MKNILKFSYYFSLFSTFVANVDIDIDRKHLLEQRGQRHERLIEHEKYEGDNFCIYSELASAIDMPVFYINLDESVDRRLAMEKYYGCLNLNRIPAISFKEDSDWLKHPFSDVAGLVDDLYGQKIDPFAKRPQEPYLTPNVLPTYLATIGCLLSHLRAAYIVASLQLPYALILEDDMTPELFPGWSGASISDIISNHNFSALQLSLLGPIELFEAFGRSMGDGVTTAISNENWYPSNGAYVLSLAGATALRNTFFDFMTLKISINQLQCVNIDCCVMIFLNNTITRLPPLFLHSSPPSAEVHSVQSEGVNDDTEDKNACRWMHMMGGSTLTCGVSVLRTAQRKIVEESRRGAIALTFKKNSMSGARQNFDYDLDEDEGDASSNERNGDKVNGVSFVGKRSEGKRSDVRKNASVTTDRESSATSQSVDAYGGKKRTKAAGKRQSGRMPDASSRSRDSSIPGKEKYRRKGSKQKREGKTSMGRRPSGGKEKKIRREYKTELRM